MANKDYSNTYLQARQLPRSPPFRSISLHFKPLCTHMSNVKKYICVLYSYELLFDREYVNQVIIDTLLIHLYFDMKKSNIIGPTPTALGLIIIGVWPFQICNVLQNHVIVTLYCLNLDLISSN